MFWLENNYGNGIFCRRFSAMRSLAPACRTMDGGGGMNRLRGVFTAGGKCVGNED
ncbi:MAG: hypothetical protein SPI30_03850 [Prevotella sp.]|nr:hypothetical protein [Prevotella sp.]